MPTLEPTGGEARFSGVRISSSALSMPSYFEAQASGNSLFFGNTLTRYNTLIDEFLPGKTLPLVAAYRDSESLRRW